MNPQTTETDEKKDGEAQVVLSLEELIKSNITGIVTLIDEKRKKSAMLKSGLDNDTVYRDLDLKAKKARNTANALKVAILDNPQNRMLAQQVKDTTRDIREKKAALSDYLLEYKRITNVTQLDLFDGEVGDIVLSAQIVMRPSKKTELQGRGATAL